MAASPCLVGDIGGTNARFAIADRSADTVRLREPQSFLCADFDRAEAAIDHYLETTGAARPADCVLAVAGPVEDGVVDGNTLNWKMQMKVPMPMTLTCTATIDGDTLTGTVNAGAFGSMAMTGTRKA